MDGDKTHVCTYENCNKSFSKPSRLLNHKRTHTGERPYVCRYEGCYKQYTRSAHLRRHEEVSHGIHLESPDEAEITFSCDVTGCTAKFQSNYSLKKHQQRTHEQESFKCPYIGCDEVFKKHQQLKVHSQTHSKTDGQNVYRCPFEGCGKTFPFPNRLKKHVKTHEGYRCTADDCSETFEKWTQLCQHRRQAHSQTFDCKTCGKTFTQKNRLKLHAAIHSDSRQAFECPHNNCNREYMEMRNLKAHLRSYHNKERFVCQHPDCANTYTTKQKLQQHQAVHNPNRSTPKKKRKRKTLVEKLTGVKASQSAICDNSVDSAITQEEVERDCWTVDQTGDNSKAEDENFTSETDDMNDSGLSEIGSPDDPLNNPISQTQQNGLLKQNCPNFQLSECLGVKSDATYDHTQTEVLLNGYSQPQSVDSVLYHSKQPASVVLKMDTMTPENTLTTVDTLTTVAPVTTELSFDML